MIFYFTLNGDSLKLLDFKTEAKTGNVNSYICKFQPDDEWPKFKVFASFKSNDKVFTTALSDDFTCTIPSELLLESGKIFIGLYATNFSNEDFKRISTNWVMLSVSEGAYVENATSPAIPTPDFWEELSKNMTPTIGENGNWFTWDIENRVYIDTGVMASGNVDHEFSETSKNPLANDIITKRFKESDESIYKKEDSDYRYLLKKKVFAEDISIENVDDYIPFSSILDCQIIGFSYQNNDPTITQAQDIYSVGDLVTDTSNEHFGKYYLPYTFNETDYHLYLDEPLKGIKYYGTNYSNSVGEYEFTCDYIDFKNKCVVKNIGEIIIDDISLIKEQNNICTLKDGKLWVTTVLNVPDMTTSHPKGRWIFGDILSDRLQTYKKASNTIPVTDNYVMAPNEENNLYFYWDLNLLGFTYELGDESDYLLITASGDYYKVKDENSNYLTDFLQIRERIKKLYEDKPIKLYYPLSSSKIEPINLPNLSMPESGPVDFWVDTELSPREINFCYYADITEQFTELKKRVDNLEAAVLSMGADI